MLAITDVDSLDKFLTALSDPEALKKTVAELKEQTDAIKTERKKLQAQRKELEAEDLKIEAKFQAAQKDALEAAAIMRAVQAKEAKLVEREEAVGTRENLILKAESVHRERSQALDGELARREADMARREAGIKPKETALAALEKTLVARKKELDDREARAKELARALMG